MKPEIRQHFKEVSELLVLPLYCLAFSAPTLYRTPLAFIYSDLFISFDYVFGNVRGGDGVSDMDNKEKHARRSQLVGKFAPKSSLMFLLQISLLCSII